MNLLDIWDRSWVASVNWDVTMALSLLLKYWSCRTVAVDEIGENEIDRVSAEHMLALQHFSRRVFFSQEKKSVRSSRFAQLFHDVDVLVFLQCCASNNDKEPIAQPGASHVHVSRWMSFWWLLWDKASHNDATSQRSSRAVSLQQATTRSDRGVDRWTLTDAFKWWIWKGNAIWTGVGRDCG